MRMGPVCRSQEQGVGMFSNESKQWILLAAMLAVSACSSMGVEPWERDVLAKDEMQLVTDPVEAGIA